MFLFQNISLGTKPPLLILIQHVLSYRVGYDNGRASPSVLDSRCVSARVVCLHFSDCNNVDFYICRDLDNTCSLVTVTFLENVFVYSRLITFYYRVMIPIYKYHYLSLNIQISLNHYLYLRKWDFRQYEGDITVPSHNGNNSPNNTPDSADIYFVGIQLSLKTCYL